MSDPAVSGEASLEAVLVEYRSVAREFLESFRDENGRYKYRERVSEALRKGRRSVVIDYMDLYSYNEVLAERLLNEPLRVLREVIEPALNEYIATEFNVSVQLRARIRGMPVSYRIRDLRNEHVGKLIEIEGIVVRMTPPKQRLAVATIHHTDCGNKFRVEVEGEYFETPKTCPICGSSRGSFELVEEESTYIDYQKIVISEMPEEIPPGHMPRQITVVLEEDLVDIARPGDRVSVTGVLRLTRERPSRRRVMRSVYDAELYATYIELSHKGVEQVELSEKDIEEIKKLARDPLIKRKIIASIAPTIYGLWDIKEAIALLLFGGVPKVREDGTRVRGDIHVLLIGDPGTAKSQLLQFTAKIAPRGIFTTGRGSTAAGLCVSRDSLVYTGEGLREIESLFHEKARETVLTEGVVYTVSRPLGVYSYSFSRGSLVYTHASHLYMLRTDTLVRIETSLGRDLVVSPETRVLVYRDGVKTWKKAEDIREGDMLIVARRIPYREDAGERLSVLYFMPRDLYVEVSRGHSRDIITIEDLIKTSEREGLSLRDFEGLIERIYYKTRDGTVSWARLPRLDNDFIELYGLFFSRAVLVDRGGESVVVVPVRDDRERLYIEELVERVFGRHVIERRTCPVSLDSVEALCIESPVVVRVLESLGVSRDLYSRRLHPYTALLPEGLLVSLLRVVFREHGYRDSRGLVYVFSRDRVFLRQLSSVLKRLGIVSGVVSGCRDEIDCLVVFDKRSLERIRGLVDTLRDLGGSLETSVERELYVSDLDENFSLARVREVWIETGDIVYDMTVDSTENFLVEDYIVHNTASVLRDKTTGEYYLEAGALVLGDLGVVCIDEIDKMREEDRVAIHEALEQQTVSISKAGIHAILNARASVLAAGNPKYGRYEEDRHIADNINLPPTILSRFDLIFVIKDRPNPDEDRRLASYIVEAHSRYEELRPLIEPELLKKYIAYARTYVKPVMKEEARRMLVDFFVEMRRAAAESKGAPLPITARQMEALIRLAEAHARLSLKEVVEEEDAAEAIRLMLLMLSNVGIDVETRDIDIDSIMTGKPMSKRRKIHEIEDVIKQITKVEGKPCAPLSEIVSRLQEKNIPQEEVERLLNTLYREGIVTQTRFHCYRLVE